MIKLEKAGAKAGPGNVDIVLGIVEKLALPNGFAKLSPQQRRLLLVAVLASIVPADGRVRKIELERLEIQLRTKFQMNKGALAEVLDMANREMDEASIEAVSHHLPELLSIEDRTQLVGLLWDLALCDHELHSKEEDLIYRIADAAGVVRRRVAEQQAIAASRNGFNR